MDSDGRYSALGCEHREGGAGKEAQYLAGPLREIDQAALGAISRNLYY